MESNAAGEGIVDTAIYGQLLRNWERGGGHVFKGPEAMPTGTGDDGSGGGMAATEDDALVPWHAEGRGNDAVGRDEGDGMLL